MSDKAQHAELIGEIRANRQATRREFKALRQELIRVEGLLEELHRWAFCEALGGGREHARSSRDRTRDRRADEGVSGG